MTIVSGVFPPILGWLEVVIDREDEGRALQPGVGPVIAPVAHPLAKVSPEPFGIRAHEPLVVLQQVDQRRIQMLIDQAGQPCPPAMRCQLRERALRFEVGGRIEDGTD